MATNRSETSENVEDDDVIEEMESSDLPVQTTQSEMTNAPAKNNLFVLRKFGDKPRQGGQVSTLKRNNGFFSRYGFGEEELDLDNSPAVQVFVNTTGCPIYSTVRLDPDDCLGLLLDPATVDVEKVCVRIPPSCPDKGYWVFVISLDHVDPDDISFDELGKWNKPSGKRYFAERSGLTISKVPSKVKNRDPDVWDYVIRCNRYTHPGTDEKFTKWTYLAFNQNNDLLGPYGLIVYYAEVHPDNLRRLGHGNSRSVDKPMIRTKRSTLKQAKSMLTTRTPKEIIEAMNAAQAVIGDDDPTYVPKDMKQINSLALNTPGAKPRGPRGRPRAGATAARTSGGLMPRLTSPHSPQSPINRRYGGGSQGMSTLQIEVLQAEKRKYDTETEKLELEIGVLKAQRFKLDLEISKLRSELDPNVVIVQEGSAEYSTYSIN